MNDKISKQRVTVTDARLDAMITHAVFQDDYLALIELRDRRRAGETECNHEAARHVATGDLMSGCPNCGSQLKTSESVPQTSKERVALLERIARLATELCVSVDKAAEDIGGERPALEILRDIGPLTDQLEKLGPEPAAGVGVIYLAGSPTCKRCNGTGIVRDSDTNMGGQCPDCSVETRANHICGTPDCEGNCVERAHAPILSITFRPLLVSGTYGQAPNGIVILIDSEQPPEQQLKAVWHEVLHLVLTALDKVHDENWIETAALRLATACPDLLSQPRASVKTGCSE